MADWIIAVLLGGAVGLDSTSFPQAMYSRPFVAGALAGLLAGRPVEGVVIGMLLEIFALPILPFGAAGYPESGTAAVASVLAYDWVTPAMDAELLFLTIAFGLFLSHASGYSVRLLRIRNGRAVGGYEGEPIEGDVVERAHLLSMALDFVRGSLVTTAGTAVLILALGLAVRTQWGLPVPAFNLLIVAAAMMIGGSLTIFGTVRERILSFGLGAALTALAVWVF